MIIEIALITILVRQGDTLSGLAAAHGESLALVEEQNHQILARSGSFNLIYPGEPVYMGSGGGGGAPGDGVDHDGDVDSGAPSVASAPAVSSSGFGGTLSYSGLESLWESAGGPIWAAPKAACIALRESGGQQYATGPFGERGYWQINPDHGPLSTYDPIGNARAAVIISSDGTNWSPWTTAGLC